MKFRTVLSLFLFCLAAAVSCGKAEIANGGDDSTKKEETPSAEYTAGDSLLVGSFNIRYYNNTKDTGESSWESRKDAVVKYVRTVRPDLLGFQEVRPTQAKALISGLSDIYGFYDIDRNTGKEISSGATSGEGVAIIYRLDRFNVEDKGFIWLADDPDTLPEKTSEGTYCWGSGCRRVLLWVKATDKLKDNRTVYFFATHFDNYSTEARVEASKLSVKQIKKVTGIYDLKNNSKVPIYLVGDLNCIPTGSDLDDLKAVMKSAADNAKTKDATLTFNGFGSSSSTPRTLDYIFYSGPLKAQIYKVRTENYGVPYISDHYPITFLSLYKI